jgi:hypothetical protein
MSTGAPTLERVTATTIPNSPTDGAAQSSGSSSNLVDVSGPYPSGTQAEPSIWHQVDELLRGAGKANRDRVSFGTRRTLALTDPRREWRTVAPGFVAPAEEYEQRFTGVDLEGLRARMSPEVFTAYIRFLGVIPGKADLDIVEIARLPDD